MGTDRKQLENIEGFEKAFKQWCNDAENTGTTAKTYWSQIKDLPLVSLIDDETTKIAGILNKLLESEHHKSCTNQYIEFLFEEWQEDDIPDDDYEDIRIKKNTVQQSLELKKTDKKKKRSSRDKSDKHIYPQHLIKILEKADPEKAKFWFVMYDTAGRASDVKRAEPGDHLIPERGKYGGIYFEKDRTKSKLGRVVEFRFPETIKILQNAPTGRYKHDEQQIIQNGFFPERGPNKDKYWMQKWSYQVVPTITDRKRGNTVHDIRHTRITHLAQGSDMEKDDVRIRAGHGNKNITDKYTNLTLRRDAKTLEQYVEENNIDIMKVLNNED